jgi:gamma-glutamylcysteine synthetase
LNGKPPFGDDKKLEELLRRLNEIPGVDIPAHRINGIPTFPLSLLKDEAALDQFLEVFNWFVKEVKAT